MIIECQNCGAPLNVQEGSSLARCCYCGKTQRVRRARTQLPQTPAGWQPPPQWTPPPQFRAQSLPLRYDAGKTVGKVVLWIVVLSSVLPVIIAGVVAGLIFMTGSSSSSSTSSRPTPSPMPATGGGSPMCKAAAACCRKVGSQGSNCDNLEQLPDEQACARFFEGTKRAAEAMGQTCDPP